MSNVWGSTKLQNCNKPRNIPTSKRVIHINWPFHNSISLWPLGQLLLWGFNVDCSTFQTRSASESCRSPSASKIAIRLRSKIVDALTQHSSIKGDRGEERVQTGLLLAHSSVTLRICKLAGGNTDALCSTSRPNFMLSIVAWQTFYLL